MMLRQPPPWLRPAVIALWSLRGVTSGLISGLPKPYVELIFSLSGDHRWQPSPGAIARNYQASWITPVQLAPRFASCEGMLHLVGARLSLSAAQRLFGSLPIGDGAAPIEAGDVLGPVAERLRERLAECTGEESRLNLLARWLWLRLDGSATIGLPAGNDLARIRWRCDGLAALYGVSNRGLRARFQQCFGISPKLWLRLNRFDALVRTGIDGRALADLAAAFDYSDQSHLTTDFRRFAGVTPTRYAAARSRNQAPQAAPHLLPLH